MAWLLNAPGHFSIAWLRPCIYLFRRAGRYGLFVGALALPLPFVFPAKCELYLTALNSCVLSLFPP